MATYVRRKLVLDVWLGILAGIGYNSRRRDGVERPLRPLARPIGPPSRWQASAKTKTPALSPGQLGKPHGHRHILETGTATPGLFPLEDAAFAERRSRCAMSRSSKVVRLFCAP
jgi:hypothetical protein